MSESVATMDPVSAEKAPETRAAVLGVLAGVGALFSAAACCILPLGLAAAGLGAGGLAAVVPFHWPLTALAILALAAGWFFYLRKRRACAPNSGCAAAPPARRTLIMLSVASLFVALSASWQFIEGPLMRSLGGA